MLLKRSYSIQVLFFAVAFLVQVSIVQAQFLKKKNNDNIPSQQLQESEYIYTEGVKEYTLENYTKALSIFEKAISLNKDAAGSYYMIGQIYYRQGNYFKAIQYAEKAIQLEETNKYYYLLLAQIYERKQDYNESVKVYLSLFKKVPNTTEYYYDLANTYLILGKHEEAIKCYDKVEKVFGINEEIIKLKQQSYLKLKKIEEAINQGRKLAEAFPDEPRYQIDLAELLLSSEKTEEAEKVVNELLRKSPKNPYGLLVMSEIYKSKGQIEKSNQHLEKAFQSPELSLDNKISILIGKVRQLPNEELKQQCLILGQILVDVHPEDAKAYAMYGDILTLSGNGKDALENYLRAIRIDNTHFKIWQQIVLLDHEFNRIDSLIRHSEKALELFPNQAVFWFYNGIGYQIKKQYKKSTVAFEEGKKMAANDKNLLLQFNTMLGDSYNGTKEYKKSDDAFEEALRLDANNLIVLNNYSYYLSLRKEKLDYAKKLSEKVVKEDPDNATYLDTYAWILYVMKDYSKAKDVFEKIANNTNNGTIVEHYGDVLFQLGDKAKAMEQWKKAKQMGDTSEFLEKKIADHKLYE